MADIERQRNFSIYPFRTPFFTCTRTSAAKNHQGSGEISWLLLFMYISTQILAWNYKSFQVSLYLLIKVLDCVRNEHIQDACWQKWGVPQNSQIKYFSIFTDSLQKNSASLIQECFEQSDKEQQIWNQWVCN